MPGNIGHSDSQRYNWNLTTVRQEFLDNENRTLAQGRVVGGSTIMNGLCWTRGSKGSFNAWEALGNPGWGWDDLLPYFVKVGYKHPTGSCIEETNARCSRRSSRLRLTIVSRHLVWTTRHTAIRDRLRSDSLDTSTTSLVSERNER